MKCRGESQGEGLGLLGSWSAWSLNQLPVPCATYVPSTSNSITPLLLAPLRCLPPCLLMHLLVQFKSRWGWDSPSSTFGTEPANCWQGLCHTHCADGEAEGSITPSQGQYFWGFPGTSLTVSLVVNHLMSISILQHLYTSLLVFYWLYHLIGQHDFLYLSRRTWVESNQDHFNINTRPSMNSPPTFSRASRSLSGNPMGNAY